MGSTLWLSTFWILQGVLGLGSCGVVWFLRASADHLPGEVPIILGGSRVDDLRQPRHISGSSGYKGFSLRRLCKDMV